jgi:hypothetical protein
VDEFRAKLDSRGTLERKHSPSDRGSLSDQLFGKSPHGNRADTASARNISSVVHHKLRHCTVHVGSLSTDLTIDEEWLKVEGEKLLCQHRMIPHFHGGILPRMPATNDCPIEPARFNVDRENASSFLAKRNPFNFQQ